LTLLLGGNKIGYEFLIKELFRKKDCPFFAGSFIPANFVLNSCNSKLNSD